jgi:hypothetical protein
VTSALQAGFGSTEITPPLGIDLCGYGPYLDRRAKAVLDPLYARCLVLDDGPTRLAIAACDLIGFAIPYSDDVRRRIARACDTSAERVMLACTHTHSGPNTGGLLAMGTVDGRYMAQLPNLIVEACTRAVADLAPAEIGWAVGAVEPIGFCRLPELPDDYVDPPLGVLLCRRESGDIGLIQYACHAVTLGVNAELSADYPGAVLRRMREHGVEALFLNGPSGDIDPLVNKVKWGSGTFADVERYGRHLADRARDLLCTIAYSSRIPLSAGEGGADLPVRTPDRAEAERALAAARDRYAQTKDPSDRFELEWSERALEMLERNAPRELDFVVQVVGIGGLKLVGLSGEIYSSVGRLATRAAGGTALAVAQANGVTGYIPDDAALAACEDYGSHGAAKIYGHFPLDPQAPRLIAGLVAALAQLGGLGAFLP